MIIYEVNLSVEQDVAHEFETWLKEHVPIVVKIGNFSKAQIFSQRLEDENNKEIEKVLWTVHYHVKDRMTLENYMKNHTQQMRAEAVQRFPSKFSATRRILEESK